MERSKLLICKCYALLLVLVPGPYVEHPCCSVLLQTRHFSQTTEESTADRPACGDARRQRVNELPC